MVVTIVREITNSSNQMKYTDNCKRPMMPKLEKTKVIISYPSSGDSRNVRALGQNFGGNSINPTSEYNNILKG
jgi:hypothetical protein